MGLIVHSCKCCSLLPYVWVQPKVSYSTSTNCKNIGKHLFLHILKWMAMNTVNDHLYFVYCEQNLVLWTISLTHSEYQHWGIVVCTTCYGCRDKQPRATEQHSHWIGTAGHKKKKQTIPRVRPVLPLYGTRTCLWHIPQLLVHSTDQTTTSRWTTVLLLSLAKFHPKLQPNDGVCNRHTSPTSSKCHKQGSHWHSQVRLCSTLYEPKSRGIVSDNLRSASRVWHLWKHIPLERSTLF